MGQGLPVNRIVNVDVIMSPRAASARHFGSLLILGTSTVIPIDERIRLYASAEDIGHDFSIDSEEYKAAAVFFAQSPKPTQCYVARWVKVLATDEQGKIETLTEAVNECLQHNGWYGIGIADPEGLKESDVLSAASAIEAASNSRVLAITTADPAVLSATSSNDVASKLKAANYSRTFIQYASSNQYAALSAFGRAFTVNFTGSNTVITLKFKQQPSITYERLTVTQVNALEAKNCNVYVRYENESAILEQGVMSNGDFFDERHGLDWLQNHIQTNLFNTLYTSNTKIPQTDAGVTRLLANVEMSMSQAATNGLIAPGIWNGEPIGQLPNGAMLTKGYYVYAQPLAEQNQSDRESRKAPSMQIACKLAGAIHYADVQINVMR